MNIIFQFGKGRKFEIRMTKLEAIVSVIQLALWIVALINYVRS